MRNGTNALKWGEIANFETSETVRERGLRIRDEEVVGSNPATPTIKIGSNTIV